MKKISYTFFIYGCFFFVISCCWKNARSSIQHMYWILVILVHNSTIIYSILYGYGNAISNMDMTYTMIGQLPFPHLSSFFITLSLLLSCNIPCFDVSFLLPFGSYLLLTYYKATTISCAHFTCYLLMTFHHYPQWHEWESMMEHSSLFITTLFVFKEEWVKEWRNIHHFSLLLFLS